MAMEHSILRPWPSPVRGRGLQAAVCSTVHALYRTVQLHSERLRTRRPIMGFPFILRAYHPHLRASFYKTSFRLPCSIGWRRETPPQPRSYCGPRAFKRSIFSHPPAASPFPGAPHSHKELGRPELPSTYAALSGNPTLVALPEGRTTRPLAR